MRLKIRAPSCADFEVEVEPSAAVGEVKILATAGCDVDPEVMKLICRGRVLRDEDTLQACGIDGADALHVARGKAPAAGAADKPQPGGAPAQQPSPAAAAGSAGAAGAAAGAEGQGGAVIRVAIRGPGGVDTTINISPTATVAALRAEAAALCHLPADHAHLVHRGRILKDDGASLAASAVADGDLLRVARRAVQEPPSASAAQAPAAPGAGALEGAAGAPMPMAWGSAPNTLSALLGREDPEALEALAAQLARARPPARNALAPVEVRLGREVQAMEREVRRLVVQQQRAEAERAGALIPGQQQEVPAEAEEEDPELLDHIARMMAEARARGAPVPRAAQFVERALSRARDARALGERLEREASGLQPELEDALAAAEQSTAAAARAPRRLGGAPPQERPPR